MTAVDKKRFWDSFLRAVEVEPTTVRSLPGASGFEHRLVASGIDRKRQRLVVVSSEPSARIAALAQADIQAAMPSYKVVGARPISINLAAVAALVTGGLGTVRLGAKHLAMVKRRPEVLKRALERFMQQHQARITRLTFQANQIADLDLLTTWQEVLQQLSLIDFQPNATLSSEDATPNHDLELGQLVALDPAEHDRQQGVCSIPLYELTDIEAECFHSGSDIEGAREALRRHQVLQYFFPAPDHIALGLIARGDVIAQETGTVLKRLPEMGHPLAVNELLDKGLAMVDIIDALKDRGYVADGELGVELTPSGQVVRQSVQFKPREGIFAKIARVIKIEVKVDLNQLFKG